MKASKDDCTCCVVRGDKNKYSILYICTIKHVLVRKIRHRMCVCVEFDVGCFMVLCWSFSRG